MIKNYINHIHKTKRFSTISCRDEDSWYFEGDGTGDFEDGSDKTTPECLRNYIEDCEEQIALAKEHLSILESSPWNS